MLVRLSLSSIQVLTKGLGAIVSAFWLSVAGVFRAVRRGSSLRRPLAQATLRFREALRFMGALRFTGTKREHSWVSLAVGFAACLSSAVGCERSIPLGELPSKRVQQGGAGGAQEVPSALPDTLAFFSGFETADLSEWNEEGSSLVTSGGVISVGTDAHQGGHAALITTEETGEHVVVSVGGPWDEVLVGFWIKVDELHTSPNWPIVHIDAAVEEGWQELWDLGLDNSVDGQHRLFLWEKPALSGDEDGSRLADGEAGFGLGVWVHIQVHLRAVPDEGGFIRVYQAGELVIDLSGRPAGSGGELQLGFGSFAYDLEPLPARFWLDDVTVHVPQ